MKSKNDLPLRLGPPPAAPGTVAYAAVEYLKRHPMGTELSTAELCSSIGQHSSGFAQNLGPSVRARMLRRRKFGHLVMWSLGSAFDLSGLPEEFEPSDEDGPAPGRGAHQLRLSALAAPSVFALGEMATAPPFSVSLSTDGRMVIERKGRVIVVLSNEERRVIVKAATQGIEVAA